jgi:lysophospholipase L1-like esterase
MKKTLRHIISLLTIALLVIGTGFSTLTSEKASAAGCDVTDAYFSIPNKTTTNGVGVITYKEQSSKRPVVTVHVATTGCVGKNIVVSVTEENGVNKDIKDLDNRFFTVPASGEVQITLRASEENCDSGDGCRYHIEVADSLSGNELYNSSQNDNGTPGDTKIRDLRYSCDTSYGSTCGDDGPWNIIGYNTSDEYCVIKDFKFDPIVGNITNPGYYKDKSRPQFNVVINTFHCQGEKITLTLTGIQGNFTSALSDSGALLHLLTPELVVSFWDCNIGEGTGLCADDAGNRLKLADSLSIKVPESETLSLPFISSEERCKKDNAINCLYQGFATTDFKKYRMDPEFWISYDCDSACSQTPTWAPKFNIDSGGNVVQLSGGTTGGSDVIDVNSPCLLKDAEGGSTGEYDPDCYELISDLPLKDAKGNTIKSINNADFGNAGLSTALGSFYKFLIALASVLAVIMFAVAVFRYWQSDKETTISLFKNRLGGIVIGVLLLVGIPLVLVTINPDLIRLEPDIPEVTIIADKDYKEATGKAPVSTDKAITDAIQKSEETLSSCGPAEDFIIPDANSPSNETEGAGTDTNTDNTPTNPTTPSSGDTNTNPPTPTGEICVPNNVDPCVIKTLVSMESRSNPKAIGHDENVRKLSGIRSRKLFVESGETYTGTPFAASYGDSKENDDKKIAPSEDGLGLDWRFSHGIGLFQITIIPDGVKAKPPTAPAWAKNKAPKRTIKGVTYTAKDLLDVDKNTQAMFDLFNSGVVSCGNLEDAFRIWNGGRCKTKDSGSAANAYAASAIKIYNSCKGTSGGGGTTTGTQSGTPAVKKILFLGDSMTVDTQGYAEQFKATHPDWSVTKSAVNGQDSSQLLTALKAIKQNGDGGYAAVSILIGTNDVYKGLTTAKTESNLDEIYTLSKQLGAKVIAVSPPADIWNVNPGAYNNNPTDAAKKAKFDAIRNYEKTYPGITYIDFWDMTDDAGDDASFKDKIHPKKSTHTELLQKLNSVL